MTRTMSDEDLYDVLRAADPMFGEPERPAVATETSLQRVLTLASAAEAVPRRSWTRISWRRVMVGCTVAAGAEVAAFPAVNLLPASSTPGVVSNAWAKRLIAHIAAAADTGTGILHIVETTTAHDSHSPFAGTVQSWQEQTAPHANWEITRQGSDTFTTTQSSTAITTYNSTAGTLYELKDPPLSLAFEANDIAYREVYLFLHEPHPYATLKSVTPEPFGELIVGLLNAPNVSVDRDARVNGESAIKVVAKTEYGSLTLYVQPHTYKPLQLVTGGNGATTETFTTYETLPRGSTSMPNLAQLHPNAPVTIRTFNGSQPSATITRSPKAPTTRTTVVVTTTAATTTRRSKRPIP